MEKVLETKMDEMLGENAKYFLQNVSNMLFILPVGGEVVSNEDAINK